jgi:squalene-hopene/tetraprenyl-beta-curcumene cyclase
MAKQFSLAKAAQALDRASLDWTKNRGCFTCHTNYPYLYARSLIFADDPAPREIRQALENWVTKMYKDGRGPKNFYSVGAATSLAISDSISTKKLHPMTKMVLDHMWTFQGQDGVLQWGGGGPPVGSRHFGMMMVSIATSVAPEGYAKTEAAQQGLARIRSSWRTIPPRPFMTRPWSCGLQAMSTAI